MDNGIHFISGLPRSGSTLLAALLRQNPRFSANMTSPVGSLFMAMLRETSQRNEAAVFFSDAQRARLLRSCFDAYYADVHPSQTVFDTNRLWTSKLPTLVELFPDARVICCVRNPSWILDSFERLVRRNPLQASGIFNFEPHGTVYSRVEALSLGTGIAGFAWNALREAVFGEQRDRLLLVRYESLVARPLEVLACIYDALGVPPFRHDPDAVEQDPLALAFDERLGTPGLHSLRRRVDAADRETVLPPDLFAKFENDCYWDRSEFMSVNVRVI